MYTSVMGRPRKASGMALLRRRWRASVTGSDYLNAIPKKSTALISVDLQQMASDKNAEDKAGMLKSLLHVDDVDKCGIDISEKLISSRVPMAISVSVPR